MIPAQSTQRLPLAITTEVYAARQAADAMLNSPHSLLAGDMVDRRENEKLGPALANSMTNLINAISVEATRIGGDDGRAFAQKWNALAVLARLTNHIVSAYSSTVTCRAAVLDQGSLAAQVVESYQPDSESVHGIDMQSILYKAQQPLAHAARNILENFMEKTA